MRSRNKLLLKDFTGKVEWRGKKDFCIEPCVKFIKLRRNDNKKKKGLSIDQTWHGLPCYGRNGKSALLCFNGFQLYRLGVTTSNIIMEILA